MLTVYHRSILLYTALGKSVWFSGGISLLGALLILSASLSTPQFRGNVIALLGALFFTVYLFLVEHDSQQEGHQFWAVVGIEHLCIALWMTLFSLLFGDWQHFHPLLSKDIAVVVYIGLACTFFPVILTHFAHRYIEPLETAFISLLEPLWGVMIAHLYLGEVVPFSMYFGGGLIMSGTLLHVWSSSGLVVFRSKVKYPGPRKKDPQSIVSKCNALSSHSRIS